MTAGREGDGPLLLGVRHHGPGSARAVRAALAAREPEVLLIEGPPEADAVVGLAADEGMVPPVALLAHAVNEPGKAAFWPLAEFSPEWVAIRWAMERGVPVRFMDLPAAHALALTEEEGESAEEGEQDALRIDPLAVLAETAGYDDAERWWEDVIEHRGAGKDPSAALPAFAALGEAMGELRVVHGDGGHRRDLVREAHMRLRLREACKEFGDAATAVVCGAWHVPALTARTTATADRYLLKGLPKVKAEITWVPWTHRRLARRSGYGAGIASPGWYGHLFSAPDRPVERWMTKVAGLLREQDRGVSSAHVIEAVRLADTLAAMRGRPLAGLTETTDAIRAVMCEGSDVPLGLIRDRLIVGDVLGEVPDGAPAVPLQRDLARQQRAVRLKPEAAERELDLDLRKDTDAARSRLLHRLRLLGIGWGEPSRSRTESTGTFRESWRLRWEPELSVRVAEAGVWGTTVREAATAKARSEALESGAPLAQLTALAEQCLLAELPEALPDVMRVLADRAALESDVGRLAQALPALVRTVRYGDVRGTDAQALGRVAEGLAERVCVGLPPACVSLDDEGAREMRGHLDAAHHAVGLLARDGDAEGTDGPEAGGADGSAAGGAGGPAAGGEDGPAAEGTDGPEAEGTDGSAAGDADGSAAGDADGPAAGGEDGSAAGGAGGPAAGGEDGSAAGGTGGPEVEDAGGPEAEGADGPAAGGADGPEAEGTGGTAVGGADGPAAGGEDGPAVGGADGPEAEGTDGSAAEGADGSAVGGAGGLMERWRAMLRSLALRDRLPGLIRGRCARLLLDDGRLSDEEAARLMGLVLSPGTPPAEAAAWIEGFLAGGGMLLLHDERLLGLVDGWLSGVPADAFTDVLPLLRRTFSEYEPGVRRSLGELVRRPSAGRAAPVRAAPGFGPGLDADRADAVLETVRLLLGEGVGV